MLVLSRRIGEEIIIGGEIRVRIVDIQRGRVRLGVTAPRSVSVDRSEVYAQRRMANEQENGQATVLVGDEAE